MKKVNVSGQISQTINFAMQQNYVPVIRNLIVTNDGAFDLESLRLRITCEPAFAKPYECLIGALKVGEATEITPVNLMVSPEYLMSLTERMLGILHIEVRENNEEMSLLFTQDINLQLLAYDEWSGLFIMPEMVAAFVTPNQQAVMEIVSAAGQFLMNWIGDPAFTGYQRQNPHIVKMQMAAIYAALQTKNIAYCMPQASFEVVGQRIRLPETVMEQKLGTCLDLSILYAACLEAVGLNPLLVFKDGHCFAGAWLEERTFADCVMDDVTSLTKRIAQGIEEIALVECTDFVVGKSVDFDTSVKHGANHLAEPDKFQLAVDITRSRGGGIRPMPTRVLQNGVFVAADYGERKKKDITEAPTMTSAERLVLNANTEKLTKQKLWERKLLDLSLRNPLLSFRVNRSAVQLMVADLSLIEDELVKGEGFKIMPRPNDWVNTLKDSKIYEIENDKDLIVTISESEFKSKRIRTFLDEQELTKNMKHLHRQAKTSMEENGSNTLYLAMGFLKWFETDMSEKARYAPLILIPVDLVRRVQDKSYTLRIRDEETQVNITLLELLRQDFGIQIGGLDPLPQDENGVDIMMVLNTFRQAVMEKKGWDVEEWAFVGLFSFSRFIMWNDLRNRSEDLKKNKVVASLMEGKLTFTENEDETTAEMLDETGLPSDMAVPMSADASQMMAISKAAKGTSFVLHGPPGTGKSQTITNMIANALYQGKTVLFVAEKMAALNVVENRLSKIGLDPFCLELHSNKSQKRAVLNQLQKTLSVTHTISPAEYEETAKELKALRNQMNEVVTLLHEPLQCGKSLRDIIAIYEEKQEQKGKIIFAENLLSGMNRESYDIWKEAIKALTVAADECGNIVDNPLNIVEMRQYSMEYREQATIHLQQFLGAAVNWNNVYITLAQQLGLTDADSFKGNYEQLVGLITLCNIMSTSPQLLPGVIANPMLEQQDGLLRQLMIMGEEVNALSAQLLAEFAPSILTYPAQDAINRLNEAKSAWALAKAMGEGKVLKEIKAHALNPSNVTKERCMSICTILHEYQQKVAYINQTAPNYYGQFGMLWAGVQTNWALLKDAYERSVAMRTVIAGIAKTQPAYQSVMQAIQGILNMPIAVRENTIQIMRQYEQLGRECLNKEAYLVQQQIRVDRWREDVSWFAGLEGKVNTMVAALPELKQWIVYLTQRDVLLQYGLQNVVTALEEGVVTSQDVIDAYEANLCYTIIMSTIRNAPALSGFQGSQFENTIERLKTTDEKFAELTIKELVAKLSAKIPQSGTVADSSEIGILKKAIKSGGRMMSIRKLFDSIPLLLRRICPCMLMSPISVAQYIDPSFPKFDLVIFDEASQLPTPEAVGAIARGENVIVVGDPKQLPPTSFFQTNHMDEENYEIEDMESVLDDCLTLSMPQTHLLWHYRSRHESLIAYSNAKYYENKLYTFPSPNDLVSEVQFVQVDGYYDKSGTRQNRAEAEAIVEEIVRRMRDPLHKHESIGVVTFSSVQQNLIDDLLVECLHTNPDLAKQNDEAEEPIIIKNLENVQGDERDVILFSVGYGPDQNGKVSMNFGPINNDGGWRRLNVAITRARKSMIVFSTLRPEQIDLNRTAAEGVAGLKGFLEFAMRGKNSLVIRNEERVQSVGRLEELIAERIRKMGYEVKTSIGCSAYKIDIGIVNPERPEEYILGIMCDGATYRLAKTARDRNILQPSVLSGLGWNLMHIWTMDWLDNKGRVLEKVKQTIEEAMVKFHEREQALKEQAERELLAAQEAEVAEQMAETASKEAEGAEQPAGVPVSAQAALEETPVEHVVTQVEAEQESETDEMESVVEAPVLPETMRYYEPANIKIQGDLQDFYEDKAGKRRQVISDIIEAEGPISKKMLAHKVYGAWGITRAGSKVEAVFEEELVALNPNKSFSNGTDFYWAKNQVPEKYCIFRVPTDDENKRTMDDIAAEEIAEAIHWVVEQQLSLTKEDLTREVAKIFGYSRVGGVIDMAVTRGLVVAKIMGYIGISEDGSRVTCEVHNK